MGPFSIYKNGGMPVNGKKAKPLEIQPGFPSRKLSSGWKDSIKVHIEDGKNLMLFQAAVEKIGILTKCEYYIHEKEDPGYRCISEAQGIEIQFCLEGEANFEIKQSRKDEFNWRYVRAGRHNIQTFNGFTNDVKIPENITLIILNIEITLDTLLTLAAKYPLLAAIVTAVKAGKNGLLFEAPRVSTNDMHLLICEIFDLENQPERDHNKIDELIDQLIVCFFEYKQQKGAYYPFKITEKFYNASLYLKENFKQPKCSIEETRIFAGIEPKIFTSGFKQLFKCSPSRYLKNLRMNKAKEILLRGEVENIKEVCTMVGLRKFKYFIAQYTLFHGVTAQKDFEQGRQA